MKDKVKAEHKNPEPPIVRKAGKNQKSDNKSDTKKEFTKEAKIRALLIGAGALILLYFLSSTFSDATPKPAQHHDSGISAAEHEQRIEQQLHRAVSAIDGVGELTIVITLESLPETIYAERGGSIRTVIAPQVRGVAIIAEGAENPVVHERIVELTSRLLGINTTRISVTH
jgi:hypothetical protein